MYDPTIGRWISEDPAGFQAGDANLYRYVHNGPTNATDPSGLQGLLPDLGEQIRQMEPSARMLLRMSRRNSQRSLNRYRPYRPSRHFGGIPGISIRPRGLGIASVRYAGHPPGTASGSITGKGARKRKREGQRLRQRRRMAAITRLQVMRRVTVNAAWDVPLGLTFWTISFARDVDRFSSYLTHTTRTQPAMDAYAEGLLKMAQQDYEGAIRLFTDVLRLGRRVASAYGMRGISHGKLGNSEACIADCTEALRLGFVSADVCLARAQYYHDNGDYPRAEADYTAAIQLNPHISLTYLGRGQVRDMTGRHSEARSDYSEAIRLDPAETTAYLNRALSNLADNNTIEALADCAEFIRRNRSPQKGAKNTRKMHHMFMKRGRKLPRKHICDKISP